MMKSLPGPKSQVLKNRQRRSYTFWLWVRQARALEYAARHYVKCIVVEGLISLAKDLAVDERDVCTIQSRALYEENFITELLPAFGKWFDRCVASGVLCPLDQFLQREGCTPVFLGGFVSQVFDRDGKLKADASVDAVRVIRQVCYYAYKVDLPYSSAKVDAVLDGFKATEEWLNQYLDGAGDASTVWEAPFRMWSDSEGRKIPTNAIAASAALFVQSVFAGANLRDLRPKHGPGVTANVPFTEKWIARLAVGSPVGKMSQLFWLNPTDAFDRLNRYPVYRHADYYSPAEGEVAKVLLVPKDSRGPRLISAEPAERQFLQQALKREICSLLESHPLSAGHVNFDDQSVNQRMAVQASKTLDWATLDLKDASDRVSRDLVDLLFGETELRDLINHVRSPYTRLPSGELVRLRKYAPMGSALCFPVLATCVWALSVAYLLGASGDLQYAIDSVYVYGDDIIVPTEHALGVSYVLELFGLKVNADKSFIGSRFAESCGVDAFDGENVTPVRLKSVWGLFIGDEFSRAQACVSLTAHASELAKRGFSNSAEYYYQLVESTLGPLPYATDTSPYIGRWCSASDWEVLQSEWTARNGKPSVTGNRTRFVGLIVSGFDAKASDAREPVTASEQAGRLWAHLYRTSEMLGRGKTPKVGVFDTPRKFVLLKRTFRVRNTSECGVYSVPEWVKELG